MILPRIPHRIGWLVVVGCLLLCRHGGAAAQTVYKWTDDRGTVHFADSPPVNTKNVEERSLPPAAPAVINEQAPDNLQGVPANLQGGPANAQPAPMEGKEPRAEGPARIVLVSKHAPRTGPAAVHLSGEVKNVGGVEAHGVSITVTAVDSTAGTPCLHQDVNVSPSTLGPGETGSFDEEIEDPCLAGGTPIDIATSSE